MTKTILATAKLYMRIFGIGPLPAQSLPSSLRNYRMTINFIHIAFTGGCVLLYLLSLVHFLIFKTRTLFMFFQATFFVVVTAMRGIVYIFIIFKSADLSTLMDDLEKIIDKRSQRPIIRLIYMNELEKSEKFANKFFNWMGVFAVFTVFLRVFESYYRYYVLHNGANSFKQLMPATLPLDWRTPNGYLIAIAIQSTWLLCGAAIVISILLAFSGICDIFGAFSIDIKQNLLDLNNIVVSASGNTTTHDRITIIRRFYAIVEFHSKSIEFAGRFSETYSSILTALFGISTPAICMALVNLNTVIDMGNWLDAVRLMIMLMFMVIYIVFLCLIGDTCSTRFDSVNNSFWMCSLTEFPLGIQKHLPFILAFTQKPIYIEGFMNVQCTRELMKKIINGSFSYFSMLRSF